MRDVQTLQLCNFAALQLSNFETLKLCNFATLQLCNFETLQLCNFASLQLCKGVVSSYQISLVLPSVAETHPKMYQSWCNLQFSICWHAGGKVLSFGNRNSSLHNILGASICWRSTHRAPCAPDYQPRARFSKYSYSYSCEANCL